MRLYLLKDKEVTVCDLETWEREFFKTSNVLAQYCPLPGVCVSTIFLGIATNWVGPPQLFETMIFGGEYDGFQDRYLTWDDAMAGHLRAIAKIQGEKDGKRLDQGG